MTLNACRPDASRLVIIDDEAQLLDLMKEFFTGAGYRVKGFTSAEDFLADLDWIAPVDCIIADVRLPGMNGLELLGANPQIKSVPIVMMSGHGDIPMAVKAIKDGAFDFIEKPFMPERLEEIVSAALSPARSQRAPRGPCSRRRQRCRASRRARARSSISSRRASPARKSPCGWA